VRAYPLLLVPSVYDSLVLDFPDAKFILFETPVDLWMKRIEAGGNGFGRFGLGFLRRRVSGSRCGERWMLWGQGLGFLEFRV